MFIYTEATTSLETPEQVALCQETISEVWNDYVGKITALAQRPEAGRKPEQRMEIQMSEIDMKAAMAPQFESGQGVVLMQRDMSDAALLMAIKTAASFGKPFKVVPSVDGGVMATADAMLDLRAKNDAYTEAELDAAVKRGAAAAAENIAAGQKLFMEDEGALDRLQNAYATGWNSLYGTADNQRLWDEFKASRNAG